MLLHQHYWTTPEAGGKVDKVNLTQFGRAMAQLSPDESIHGYQCQRIQSWSVVV